MTHGGVRRATGSAGHSNGAAVTTDVRAGAEVEGASMTFVEATRSYEGWLAQQIEIVAADLDRKHRLMDHDPFTFFRGTYYRWLQRVLELAPELNAPVVSAVGDLHVENFGVWRNAAGDRVWGINDFDESEVLPYTLDLARLAASASLAIDSRGVAIDDRRAHAAILRGYLAGLDTGGAPFVLAGAHKRLAQFVAEALPAPGSWWKKLERLPHTDRAPAAALAAIGAENLRSPGSTGCDGGWPASAAWDTGGWWPSAPYTVPGRRGNSNRWPSRPGVGLADRRPAVRSMHLSRDLPIPEPS